MLKFMMSESEWVEDDQVEEGWFLWCKQGGVLDRVKPERHFEDICVPWFGLLWQGHLFRSRPEAPCHCHTKPEYVEHRQNCLMGVFQCLHHSQPRWCPGSWRRRDNNILRRRHGWVFGWSGSCGWPSPPWEGPWCQRRRGGWRGGWTRQEAGRRWRGRRRGRSRRASDSTGFCHLLVLS